MAGDPVNIAYFAMSDGQKKAAAKLSSEIDAQLLSLHRERFSATAHSAYSISVEGIFDDLTVAYVRRQFKQSGWNVETSRGSDGVNLRLSEGSCRFQRA